MNNMNYQKKLDDIINNLIKDNRIPKLLLHSCCAPCSCYVIFYLMEYFDITVFYYNPNISPLKEYVKRLVGQRDFINDINLEFNSNIKFIEGHYDNKYFNDSCSYWQDEPEGGARCLICYKLRLLQAAIYANENNYDYFATTLTVSPYKNAKVINQIGQDLENQYNVKYLYSDFKKREGYKKSIMLSKKYNLYRQNYCGCSFSNKEMID